MNFVEMKELIGTLFITSFFGSILVSTALYKFAEITYKIHMRKVGR